MFGGLQTDIWALKGLVVMPVRFFISCLINNNNNNNNNSNNNNNDNNNGITQAAFPQSGSSSTWGTNGFTSLSKDGVAKEDHLNIQPRGQSRESNPGPSS